MDHNDIQRAPEKIIRAGLLQARAHRQATGDSDSMVVRLSRFWVWLQHRQCLIRDTHQKIVALSPNRAQSMLFAVMLIQAMLGRPIRVVVLKARKVGVTTFVKAWFIFNCRFYRNQIAVMLAHKAKATDQIFDIAKRMGEHDRLDRPKAVARLLTFKTRSSYWCHTAGSGDVTAGGTPNLLHRSELALWPANIKQKTDYASGNAVARTVPTTCIIDESTARGQDLFWGRFQAAEHAWHPFERVVRRARNSLGDGSMTNQALIDALGRAAKDKPVRIAGADVTGVSESADCVGLLLPDGVSVTANVPAPAAPPVATAPSRLRRGARVPAD